MWIALGVWSGLCVVSALLLAVAYNREAKSRHATWEGGCQRLTTCGALKIGGRVKLHQRIAKAPRQGEGFFLGSDKKPMSRVFIEDGEVSFRNKKMNLASFQRLLRDSKAQLFIQTDDVSIDKLDRSRLKTSPLVTLHPTRPEPVDLFIQPGGYTNGYWLFLNDELIERNFYVVEERLWTFN